MRNHSAGKNILLIEEGGLQTGLPQLREAIQASEYVLPYHWIGMEHNCLQRYLNLSDQIARLIRTYAPVGRGLDIGCGDGRSTFEVQRRVGNSFELIGLDFDRRAVHFAHIFAPEIDIRVTDATGRLPFADESLQFLYSREVLEHVPPDRVKLFSSEQYRVLQPGGVAIVVVPSTQMPISPKHYCHYTETTLDCVFSGFTRVEMFGFGRSPRGTLASKFFVLVDLIPSLWKLYIDRWVATSSEQGDVLVGCYRKPLSL